MKYGFVNSPMASKVNWTALIASVIGTLSAVGIVPEEHREQLLEGTLMIAGPLTIIFRSFFTVKES